MKIEMLLLILLGCVILGVIRKLRGGHFLPEPGPGEDRLVMDKTGRWWRYDQQTGAMEDALRRPPRKMSILKGFILSRVRLALWIALLAVVFALLDNYFIRSGQSRPSGMDALGRRRDPYLLLLHLGRRRGLRYSTAKTYNAIPERLQEKRNRDNTSLARLPAVWPCYSFSNTVSTGHRRPLFHYLKSIHSSPRFEKA